MSMNPRFLVRRLSAAATASLLSTTLYAQPVPCEEWAIVGADPKNNGRLQVCSATLRQVPELAAKIERLNAAAARSADATRNLAEMKTALNDLARQLKAQDINRMATSLAERIGRRERDTDERLLREFDRLRLDMMDVREKLDAARSNPQAAERAREALNGPAGEAIVRLDFATANQILDGLVRIETGVNEIKGKDTVRGVYSTNPTLLAEIRSGAGAALAELKKKSAADRCTKGWQIVARLNDSARQAEQNGDLNVAGTTYKEVEDRARAIVNELSVIDATQQSTQQASAMMQAQQARMASQAFMLARRSYQDRLVVASRMANSPALQRELGRAKQMAAEAEALASNGRAFDAADKVVDAANLLAEVEEKAGNYRFPLPRLPKPMRPNLPGLVPAMPSAETLQPNSLCR
jgi:hypothetical protein